LETISKDIQALGDRLEKKIDHVDKRVDNLLEATHIEFKNFRSDFDGFKTEMTWFRDKTEKSLFGLSSDMMDVKERLKNVETILDPVQGMVSSMKFTLNDHEGRITKLETIPA